MEAYISLVVPYALTNLYCYVDCSLFINDLTANIYIEMNIYHICISNLGYLS